MSKTYPTLGEYNQLFQKLGNAAFNSLRNITLIPSRTTPIKVYLFGSGAYAAVFKGVVDEKNYAIRCFLSADNETIYRNQLICDYINNIDVTWTATCRFIENEISIKGEMFPVLMMEWVDGVLINQFVTDHINDNAVLNELQEKLVSLSKELEQNEIGHGDLQCGNIIIESNSNDFEIKLIDYDGMYVPSLKSKRSIENGRSEFQHPKRTHDDYNSEIDRFSIWVIITALEALKYDKTLWDEVMQGGFNTLDNFLFTAQDFLLPSNSKVFERLNKINYDSLNFYLNRIKKFCHGDVLAVSKPELYSGDNESVSQGLQTGSLRNIITEKTFKIVSKGGEVTILTSMFDKIGTTPLELEKAKWLGKTIIVSNGTDVKRLSLTNLENTISVSFPVNEEKEAFPPLPSKTLVQSNVQPQTISYEAPLPIVSSPNQVKTPSSNQKQNYKSKARKYDKVFYLIGGLFLFLLIGILIFYAFGHKDWGNSTNRSATKPSTSKTILNNHSASKTNTTNSSLNTHNPVKHVPQPPINDTSTNKYTFHRNDILELLKKYYEADYGKDVYGLKTFYNFPIQSYFSYKNIEEYEFHTITRNGWSLISHSLNTPSYDELQIQRDNGNYSLTYPLTYEYTLKESGVTKINTYRAHLKLNRSGKIYYVQNKLLTSEIKPSEMDYLKGYASFYPSDIGLFDSENLLYKRMHSLLGGALCFEILSDLTVESPLIVDNNHLYLSICEPNNCIVRNAIVVFDFSKDKLHVSYKNGSYERIFSEKEGGSLDVIYWKNLRKVMRLTDNSPTHSSKSKPLSTPQVNTITETVLKEEGSLRKGPYVTHSEISKIPAGTSIIIIGYESLGYWKAKYGSKIGYINDVVLFKNDQMKQMRERKEYN